MLQSVSAAELRRIPPEALPREIPLEVLEEAPAELRGVLEDLALAAGSAQLGRWHEDAELWGRDAAAAIDLAHGPSDTADRTEELDAAAAEVRRSWETAGRQGPRPFLARMEEQVAVRDAVQEQTAEIFRALEALDAAAAEHGAAQRLVEARQGLLTRRETIERSLARWHAVHLDLLRREMRDLRDEIESRAFEEERFREQLAALEGRLEQTRSLVRRSLRPRATQRERERLEQRITELTRELAEREWVIAERDMTRWLDGVVEASLYLRHSGQVQALRDARLQLFHLLNRFCRQQEQAAQQVARNPFLQVDPERAIEFLLVSERFILDYFARKRGDVTRWLGGAARQRLDDLEDVQKTILEEFRRHR
jgi:hypothetical protein